MLVGKLLIFPPIGDTAKKASTAMDVALENKLAVNDLRGMLKTLIFVKFIFNLRGLFHQKPILDNFFLAKGVRPDLEDQLYELRTELEKQISAANAKTEWPLFITEFHNLNLHRMDFFITPTECFLLFDSRHQSQIVLCALKPENVWRFVDFRVSLS